MVNGNFWFWEGGEMEIRENFVGDFSEFNEVEVLFNGSTWMRHKYSHLWFCLYFGTSYVLLLA